MSVAATHRDAYSLGLGSDNIVNNWGFDENLPRLAGEAAEGVMGIAPVAFFGEDVKGMANVVEYARKFNPSVPLDKRLIRTVQAWASVLGLAEALRRADKAGDLSGESILKNGFETMRDIDIGLGTPRITFTSKDHRMSGQVPVYEWKNGAFKLVKRVDLQARWPDKWAYEWIGW